MIIYLFLLPDHEISLCSLNPVRNVQCMDLCWSGWQGIMYLKSTGLGLWRFDFSWVWKYFSDVVVICPLCLVLHFVLLLIEWSWFLNFGLTFTHLLTIVHQDVLDMYSLCKQISVGFSSGNFSNENSRTSDTIGSLSSDVTTEVEGAMNYELMMYITHLNMVAK